MIKKRLIYLDNNTSSFPKSSNIYKKALKHFEKEGLNPTGVKYDLALDSERFLYNVREEISKTFNITDPLQLAFTSGSYENFEIVLEKFLKKGDHLITSIFGTNDFFDIIQKLEEKGIQTTIIEPNKNGMIDGIQVEWAIRENTKLIFFNHLCPVSGVHMPVDDIAAIATKHNIPFGIDVSFSAGLYQIDSKKLNLSFLSFSGHRYLYGPQGVGCIYIDKNINLDNDTPMPDKVEKRNKNFLGITTLYYAVEALNKLDHTKEGKKLKEVFDYINKELEEVEGIQILSKNNENFNTILIKHNNFYAEKLRLFLNDKFNIATRDNFYDADKVCKFYSYDNTLRVSLSYFNTLDDGKTFIKGIKEFIKQND